MTAYLTIDAGFSIAVAHLESLLARLTRRDARLRLEREGSGFWIVTDEANQDAVMIRTPRYQTARDFMDVFVGREAGAEIVSIESSGREPVAGVDSPESTVSQPPVVAVEVASRPDSNVVPIRPYEVSDREALALAAQHDIQTRLKH